MNMLFCEGHPVAIDYGNALKWLSREPKHRQQAERSWLEKFNRTSVIETEKQQFVDRPIIRRLEPTGISLEIAALFDHPQLLPSLLELTHFERVGLQWMKPDGKGGLVPR